MNGIEQKVIEATNGFRKENRLDTLKPTVRLIVIAQNHARNMARQDKFGDTDKNGHVLDGKGLDYRIQVGGYEFGRVAENVGYQLNKTDPADSMMQGWETSPGHRRNMLLADISEIGVGRRPGQVGALVFRPGFWPPCRPAARDQDLEVASRPSRTPGSGRRLARVRADPRLGPSLRAPDCSTSLAKRAPLTDSLRTSAGRSRRG